MHDRQNMEILSVTKETLCMIITFSQNVVYISKIFQGHSLLHGRSVLVPDQFLETTVLPYLSDGNESINIPLEAVLQLLLTTIQSRDDMYWISENQLFPIILSLCNIIDDYRNLDPTDLDRSAHIKFLAISCLSRIEKPLLQLRLGKTDMFFSFIIHI